MPDVDMIFVPKLKSSVLIGDGRKEERTYDMSRRRKSYYYYTEEVVVSSYPE
jgi:hypothetical protein